MIKLCDMTGTDTSRGKGPSTTALGIRVHGVGACSALGFLFAVDFVAWHMRRTEYLIEFLSLFNVLELS